MNAKEKAKELVEKFSPLANERCLMHDLDYLKEDDIKEAERFNLMMSKQCALIAVDEKEKTLLECIGTGQEVWGRDEFILFNELQQVKEEIEKI